MGDAIDEAGSFEGTETLLDALEKHRPDVLEIVGAPKCRRSRISPRYFSQHAIITKQSFCPFSLSSSVRTAYQSHMRAKILPSCSCC